MSGSGSGSELLDPDNDVTASGSGPGSVPNQITVALVSEIVESNDRKTVEIGLQRFNAINANDHVCETVVNAIQLAIKPTESIRMYCNPEIGALSDFAPHYKMLISVNDTVNDTDINENNSIESIISTTFTELLARPMFQNGLDIRVETAPFIRMNFQQISLVLWIGKVFHIPIFTVYVVRNAFINTSLDLKPIADKPFQHNARLITNYNRLDVLIELLLHSDTYDIYDPVNVLIARGINALVVSKFVGGSPNAVIEAGCQLFFNMIRMPELRAVIAKIMLIAIMQNPNVKTEQGDRFSDIFPSGQYGNYFGEVAYRATTIPADQGPIMITDGVPLTRTDIILAAITAINQTMNAGETDAHMVISGGAGVSYYIQDFLKKLEADPESFQRYAGQIDADINIDNLKKDCTSIKMNDIDCIVFGDVSRQFLSVFSLYMMILYDNFYARPRRYGVADKDAPPISFKLFTSSFASASAFDRIKLYMYGNRDDDSNTMLVSKRLKKDPNVQLVTQKTKCFSQIVHPMCYQESQDQSPYPGCKEDEYYLEPIDLVKKTMDHFIKLYMRSLYPTQTTDPHINEKIRTMLKHGYKDNLVTLKVMMLDIICIFCDEGASLFCRIFMARKNPKDFARLRVFIDIYLLQLLRSNPAIRDNEGFITKVRQLRGLMVRLNTDYYLEQGSIAAFNADMAELLNARRDEFLELLREVGREIVDLDAPTEPIPAQFQETTGASTIQFFKESPQMKYKFDMIQHMAQLFHCFESESQAGYDVWLTSVFETIMFNPEMESGFREKLATILSMNPESNYEVNFKDMPTRSPAMLELLNVLKNITVDDAELKKFKVLRSNLLNPIREFVASQGGITPQASYVIKVYDKTTINDLLKTLLANVLLIDHINANPGLMQVISEPAKYDDAVREEIGRILLEWNNKATGRLGGGSTRKRKRVCRLKNANTRRSNVRIITHSNTRRKRRASRRRCNHTRRN